MADQPKLSGAPLDNFQKGWARLCFVGTKAHYWVETTKDLQPLPADVPPDMRTWVALCGIGGYSTDRAQPLGVGSFPLCTRCLAKAPQGPTPIDLETFLDQLPRAAKKRQHMEQPA